MHTAKSARFSCTRDSSLISVVTLKWLLHRHAIETSSECQLAMIIQPVPNSGEPQSSSASPCPVLTVCRQILILTACSRYISFCPFNFLLLPSADWPRDERISSWRTPFRIWYSKYICAIKSQVITLPEVLLSPRFELSDPPPSAAED